MSVKLKLARVILMTALVQKLDLRFGLRLAKFFQQI